MARTRGKGIKGFEDVANTNINYDVNSGANNDSNSNAIPVVQDPLEKLQEKLPAKHLTTVLKGIYFDSEVANVIDEQAKRLGRGGKSKLINDIVKNYFIQKGLL